MEGLRIHHQVEPDDYLSYVHDLPLDHFLKPDPRLRNLLGSLPQDLWVFTNADHRHALKVLTTLHLEDLFSGIVDLYALNFVVKPNPEAYRLALNLAGETDPTFCVLFDDLLPNLITAKDLGFTTSLVGQNGHVKEVDVQLNSLLEMKEK